MNGLIKSSYVLLPKQALDSHDGLGFDVHVNDKARIDDRSCFMGIIKFFYSICAILFNPQYYNMLLARISLYEASIKNDRSAMGQAISKIQGIILAENHEDVVIHLEQPRTEQINRSLPLLNDNEDISEMIEAAMRENIEFDPRRPKSNQLKDAITLELNKLKNSPSDVELFKLNLNLYGATFGLLWTDWLVWSELPIDIMTEDRIRFEIAKLKPSPPTVPSSQASSKRPSLDE